MEDGLEGRRHLHRDVHVPQVRAVHGWGVAAGVAVEGSHDVTGTVVTPIGASQPSLTAIDSPENKDLYVCETPTSVYSNCICPWLDQCH